MTEAWKSSLTEVYMDEFFNGGKKNVQVTQGTKTIVAEISMKFKTPDTTFSTCHLTEAENKLVIKKVLEDIVDKLGI